MDTNTDATARPAPAELPGLLTAGWFSALFFGLPLVLHDGYFDITEAKYLFFAALTGVYLIAQAGVWLYGRRRPAKDGLERLPAPARLTAAEGLLAACALLSLLSAGLNGRLPAAWLGAYDRYQGVATAVLYAAAFAAAARTFRWTRLNDAALTAGCALTCLVAVLQACGVDPLSLYRGVAPGDRLRYIGCVGNIDFFGAYLALIFPFLLVRFLRAESGPGGALFAGGLAFCGGGMVTAGSESMFLGFMATLLLSPLLCRTRRERKRLLLAVGALLTGMCLLLRCLPRGGFAVSYFLGALLRPYLALPLCATLLAMGLLAKADGAPIPRFRRGYAAMLLALALLAIAALVLLNTAFTSVPLGSAARFLRLNASWGTDRGRIYARCLAWFSRYPALQTLFGGGVGAVYALDAPAPLFSDAVLDSAHSEYLHRLLTNGVLGLSCYLGFLGCALHRIRRRAAASPLAAACLLSCAVYALQAAVNIAQPFTTPLFFALLAAGMGESLRP